MTILQTGRSSLQVAAWPGALVHPLWGPALVLSISSLAARVHVYLKRIELPAQWLVRTSGYFFLMFSMLFFFFEVEGEAIG